MPEVEDPCGPTIVNKFRDWHLKEGVYPIDLDAAYRHWLRKEPKFHRNSQQPGITESLFDLAKRKAKFH